MIYLEGKAFDFLTLVMYAIDNFPNTEFYIENRPNVGVWTFSAGLMSSQPKTHLKGSPRAHCIFFFLIKRLFSCILTCTLFNMGVSIFFLICIAMYCSEWKNNKINLKI